MKEKEKNPRKENFLEKKVEIGGKIIIKHQSSNRLASNQARGREKVPVISFVGVNLVAKTKGKNNATVLGTFLVFGPNPFV